MSKKKKKKKGKKKTGKAQVLPVLPDRRGMEKFLADMGRSLEGQDFESDEEMNVYLDKVTKSGQYEPTRELTPLEQAQDLMYEAWDSSGARRVKLARQALRISPDCADAYVLLAEETATSPKEAKDLYERGVEAGKRALGPEIFEEDAGHFWGIMETRPYMRARAGLATSLWHLGKKDEATEHYIDMLRLNPGDNQGLRYTAATCLFVQRNYEALGELLNQYDERSAMWLFHLALFQFLKTGDGPDAERCLNEALKQNPFVPLYLLGQRRWPRRMPAHYGIGDENEAMICTFECIEAWLSVNGALEWLASKTLEMGGES